MYNVFAQKLDHQTKLDNQSIEVEDGYPIDDILELVRILTPDQAKRLTDEVKIMREEWNLILS